jgi:glycosyltransferase EpsF
VINMKIKVIQIGGNLRINGISSLIMSIYRKTYEDFEFIFINTAPSEGYYFNEIKELGGKAYHVNIGGKGLYRSLKQARRIREIIRIERPDAVHSHYYSNNGIYLRQAALEGVPIRISHCHQGNIDMLSIGKKIAVLCSRMLVKKYATYALACSENARNMLYKNIGFVIHNPIDYKTFRLMEDKERIYEKYGLDKDYKYILFVGRLTDQKNPLFLLDVIENISRLRNDVRLLVVGDGKLKKKLENNVRSREMQELIKIYRPESTKVEEVMNIARALLLPSLYEGFPITLVEAQAVGIKCFISSRISQESQLGLCEYLALDHHEWARRINEHLDMERKQTPIYDKRLDIDEYIRVVDSMYKGEYHIF